MVSLIRVNNCGRARRKWGQRDGTLRNFATARKWEWKSPFLCSGTPSPHYRIRISGILDISYPSNENEFVESSVWILDSHNYCTSQCLSHIATEKGRLGGTSITDSAITEFIDNLIQFTAYNGHQSTVEESGSGVATPL